MRPASIAISLALAACGSDPAPTPIRFLHTFSPEETELFNTTIAERGMAVDSSLVPFARGQQVIGEILSAGTACPDLIRIDATWLPGLRALLVPPPAELAALDWTDEAAALAKIEGTWWGVPQTVDGLIVIRDSATPAPASASIDDLVAAARATKSEGRRFPLAARVDGYWLVPWLRAEGTDFAVDRIGAQNGAASGSAASGSAASSYAASSNAGSAAPNGAASSNAGSAASSNAASSNAGSAAPNGAASSNVASGSAAPNGAASSNVASDSAASSHAASSNAGSAAPNGAASSNVASGSAAPNDSVGATRAIARYGRLFGDVVAPPPPAGSESPDELRRWNSHEVAYWLTGPWQLGALRDPERIAVSPIAHAPRGGQLLVVPRCAKRPDDGWRLAKELASVPVEVTFANRFRTIPTRVAALAQAPALSRAAADALRSAEMLPRATITPLLFDDLNPALAAVVAGDATPEEAIAGVRRGWARLARAPR